MDLPVMPPIAPMLAKLARELPVEEGMLYEPKWDGFRTIAFRDGEEVELGSRRERPMTRYFPELLGPIKQALPERCVVDGEIVIAGGEGLEFDALLQRIHPAESRVRKLSVETPASLVVFDVLAIGDEDLRRQPFAERRKRLVELLATVEPPIHLTPATTDPVLAAEWFERFEGAGLDGVIAKSARLAYIEDKRLMVKVKQERTADCAVGGFRWHKDGEGVGSLLLGLFDDESGDLHHVGVATSFTVARRKELVEELAPLRTDALKDHPWKTWAEMSGEGSAQRLPGAASRWNAKKDLSWEPLRVEWVAEVSYDHLQGDRFRHATHMVRWRPDRDPRSCTYDQLDAPVPSELSELFGLR